MGDGRDVEEVESTVDEDDEAASAAAAAASRFALLLFPGTLPILEIEKMHTNPRLAHRWHPDFSPEQRTYRQTSDDLEHTPADIWVTHLGRMTLVAGSPKLGRSFGSACSADKSQTRKA